MDNYVPGCKLEDNLVYGYLRRNSCMG